ncbi:hypothetical protein K504DRAFT_496386 [Pleomassaria siparia CBS 279.74]|uniref:Uncharacterized protein n=1 Tax=Pleomassaria siparia CBS 279.74 TaxID=1314801 RepID=A0A6G1KP83_9PLEO|nr:hypothetical protein K504DRAFT_496386 [Pleomassaria siparia CBS 279.74]
MPLFRIKFTAASSPPNTNTNTTTSNLPLPPSTIHHHSPARVPPPTKLLHLPLSPLKSQPSTHLDVKAPVPPLPPFPTTPRPSSPDTYLKPHICPTCLSRHARARYNAQGQRCAAVCESCFHSFAVDEERRQRAEGGLTSFPRLMEELGHGDSEGEGEGEGEEEEGEEEEEGGGVVFGGLTAAYGSLGRVLGTVWGTSQKKRRRRRRRGSWESEGGRSASSKQSSFVADRE